jgi:hypothetical protein
MPWRRDEVREAPVRPAAEAEPAPTQEPASLPGRPAAAPPQPERVPAPEPMPAAAPPAPAPALATAARGSQWNLWELERAMQADPEPDTDRAYERSALIVFLRDYASSDGQLPPEFDELVRDAFAELLAVR